MQLQKASRKKAKIKMGLQGPSGSGKTYSSLLIAYGLCNDWSKIINIPEIKSWKNVWSAKPIPTNKAAEAVKNTLIFTPQECMVNINTKT